MTWPGHALPTLIKNKQKNLSLSNLTLSLSKLDKFKTVQICCLTPPHPPTHPYHQPQQQQQQLLLLQQQLPRTPKQLYPPATTTTTAATITCHRRLLARLLPTPLRHTKPTQPPLQRRPRPTKRPATPVCPVTLQRAISVTRRLLERPQASSVHSQRSPSDYSKK